MDATDALEAEIHLLTPEQFSGYWPKISECLDARPELWNRSLTKESIWQSVMNGMVQMWAVGDKDAILTCFMSQVVCSPAENYLEIFWAYGHGLLERLPFVAEVVDKFAANCQCSRIDVVVAREGWKKIARPFGAEFVCATYSRPVRLTTRH